MSKNIFSGYIPVWSKSDGRKHWKHYSEAKRRIVVEKFNGSSFQTVMFDDPIAYTEVNPFDNHSIQVFKVGDLVQLGCDGYAWEVKSSDINCTVVVPFQRVCEWNSICFPTSALTRM